MPETFLRAVLIADEITEQAPITQWPVRLALVAVVLAVIALAIWAMWRNWNKRISRQDWVVLPDVPTGFVADATYLGRYVASVRTEDWLDRIAAAGLGMPGEASIAIGKTGILITRVGEPTLFLSNAALVEVTTARGIAQEVYERDGVVALTWQSGTGQVTTGLRMADPQDQLALVAAIQNRLGENAT